MIRAALLAAVAAASLTAATGVQAQALSCSLPRAPQPVHAELPSADQPRRVLPIGSYTLAISWVPEYCHGNAHAPGAAFECGSRRTRFGFSLHGLWPDGEGRLWPQYCRDTSLLPQSVIRQNMCATPSAQLLQHEWAKHGTCMGDLRPAAYFGRSTGLYATLRYPNMAALSRRPTLNAGMLAEAFAAANPGMTADMVRVTANKRGWLDELWLCLDTRFAYARCTPGSGGLAPDAKLRIWRGGRDQPLRTADDG